MKTVIFTIVSWAVFFHNLSKLSQHLIRVNIISIGIKVYVAFCTWSLDTEYIYIKQQWMINTKLIITHIQASMSWFLSYGWEKAMQWGPKHGWPGGCHIGDCWAKKNLCFSCACLRVMTGLFQNGCHDNFILVIQYQ